MRMWMVAAAASVVMAPAAAQNWAETVSVTPKGGVLIGNPAAKVKLVEYGSLSCGTCAQFHTNGLPPLKAKYLAGGKVSYEFRSFVRNGPDYAGSLIAACLPAKPQLGMLDAMFEGQGAWLQPYMKVQPADMQGVAALPMAQQFVRLAELGGLYGFAATRGLPEARARACLADAALIEKVAANRKEAVEVHGLTGTPTFVLDGKTLDGVLDWSALDPKLAAAVG
ncbi:thiol:disulfide interchange protein [Polymorphobacter multimanifer]|uniref:Protein-disulfide isomerase n=1 Tax=Polymorphobacter multimanifer TaxID=1070431 RepID=A0A841L812_9SPHN|nr:thioredoxin domain-containing protein [Polymorphobacter multimanifer]MBB6227711.1 protein-disulfide isomerase [Polymorphobacter multimanifer]GGI70699.1 thiol:disulfide interchange protein [Polymorphobacter multimanifer]